MIVLYVDHFFLKVYFVEYSFSHIIGFSEIVDKWEEAVKENKMCSVVYERTIYFLLLVF